jgi:4-hydroxybenzoate polyprenyltransferase
MRPASERPLCVELDGGLLRTSALAETIAGAVRRAPVVLLLLPWWALRGRRYVWERLAERYLPPAEHLPYEDGALEAIGQAAREGRQAVVVTDAHPRLAEAIARHAGATAGDAGAADGEWLRARRRPLGALLRALRPQQRATNVLVFLPVILGHRVQDAAAVVQSLAAFALVSMASSSVYLLNDLADLETDRMHPLKSRRPFARGDASLAAGALLAVALTAAAVGLGLLLNPAVAGLLALYILSAGAYSLWLKQLLIVDMVMLACFYAARIYLGSFATGIEISDWTALFCLLLFFGLASVKRYTEIHNRVLRGSETANRRAYRPEDRQPLLAMGASAFGGAVIALGLYLASTSVRESYHAHRLLWLVAPVMLGWSARIWILAHRGDLASEDPVAFALQDRWSYGAALLVAIVFVLAL